MVPRSSLLVAALLMASLAQAQAQLVQNGIGKQGLVTETVSLVDAWDDGPLGPDVDGLRDVLTRVEQKKREGEDTTIHLLLFGPWGQHGYGFTETAIVPAREVSTGLRTTWRAIDLDGDGPKEIVLIERFVVEGPSLGQILADDEVADAFIRKAAIGLWHASCSCRMGAADDPMAVVDATGRVRGLSGLRVIDASIFPSVPRANTNFPTLMTAEKIADGILVGN